MGNHFPLHAIGKRPAMQRTTSRAKSAKAIVARMIERPEAARIEIALPMPPSTNGLFANRASGGRFKTEAYEAWISEAGWRLQEQRPGRISGPYEIEIRVARTPGSDLDNRVKGISDLLVKHRVIADDLLAEKLTVSWLPPGSGAVVIVTKAAVMR